MRKISRRLMVFLAIISTLSLFSLWLSKKTNLVKAATPSQSEPVQAADQTSSRIESPVTDLVIDSMEVTQSVQDLNNSVPLVMGKRTFVRVYVHSTNGTYPTTATLKAQSGELSTTLLPIPPGGPLINVRQTYNRLLSSHAFLFELPKWITYFSSITLTAEVNPVLLWHIHFPEEYSYANNTISKTISFNGTAPLYLVVASQPYTFNKITYSPSMWDRWNLTDWVLRTYPVNQVKVFFRTLPTLNAQRQLNEDDNWDIVFPDCSYLYTYLAWNRASILGNLFYPKDTAFYAMVADNVGFMRGCAPIGGYYLNLYTTARVAAGPSGPADWGWDYDGTYADWYGGHELGHAFGLSHIKGGPGYKKDGCGGEAYSLKVYPDGRISPTLSFTGPTAMFGFDTRQLLIGKNPILSPWWHDLMTYCDYQWISGWSYTYLENIFKYMLPSDQSSPSGQVNAQDVLAIFGSLNLNSGELSLRPITILFNAPDVIPARSGDYSIVLSDPDGNQLASYPFSLHGLENGQSPDSSLEKNYAYVSELVPYVNGTTTVQIIDPHGLILSQVNAGIAPPTVQITSPIRGDVEDGSTITVTWAASDEDGDPLTFNVDYSSDNGASWDTVGLFYTDTQAVIDSTNFPASSLARVRVWASDGIHTTSATSDPFTIHNHLPTGQIIEPASDITVAVSQTVTFEGQVYDIELGSLDGYNIEWSSSIDGFLGNGATFSTDSLTVGSHLITMTADDGQGGVVTDQVSVSVVPTPNDLPVQADALSVGPDPVFIEPSSGIITATIYVDNLNLGNPINWSVSADQPWVQLSVDSGMTPGELTISADPSQVGFGSHPAFLTFTSPQAPREVSMRAVLNVPEYTILIPLTLK